MPKCSGPTSCTRGTSWPAGLCSRKGLVALRRRGVWVEGERGMGLSFLGLDKRDKSIPTQKAEQSRRFFQQTPYHGANGVGGPSRNGANGVGGPSRNGTNGVGGRSPNG